MNEIFTWVQNTGLSQWVTGDAFLAILTLHTLAIGLFAGLILMQVFTRWAGPPAPRAAGDIRRMYWLAFGASLLSGLLLLWGYPYKALTNWVFYGKIITLCVAMICISKGALKARGGAVMSLTRHRVWLGLALLTICGVAIAGRLLGYTYTALYA